MCVFHEFIIIFHSHLAPQGPGLSVGRTRAGAQDLRCPWLGKLQGPRRGRPLVGAVACLPEPGGRSIPGPWAEAQPAVLGAATQFLVEGPGSFSSKLGLSSGHEVWVIVILLSTSVSATGKNAYFSSEVKLGR